MIGLSFAVLSQHATYEDIDHAIEFIKTQTTTGRFAAIAWPVSQDWHAATEIEGSVAVGLLGQPTARTEERSTEEWLFHSGLFVRAYSRPMTAPRSTWQVMVIRRNGPPPYSRSHDGADAPASSRVRESSLIDVADPVFTRDVANNVWHVKNRRVARTVAARLARLTCWSDEDVIILEPGRAPREISVKQLRLSMDFIPTATKTRYDWECDGPGGQTVLFREPGAAA